MADLKFRRGPLAALASQPKVDGTLYVTTDEGAIYLDTSNSNRIRLGDFIPVNTVNDLPQAGHAYETAVYYVKTGNILARWDSTNNRWIQINKAGVVSVADETGTSGNVITGIRIDTNANGELTLKLTRDSVVTSSSFSQLQSDLSDLEDRVEDNEDAIGLLNGDASTQGSVAYAVAQEASARQSADTALGNRLTTVEGYGSRLEQAETDIGDLESIVGATANDGLRKAVADNTSAIALLNGTAQTQGSVKYEVGQAVAAVVANADASYDTLKEIADWILSDTTGAAAMNSDIQQLLTDVNDLEDRVEDLESDMGDAKAAIDLLNGNASTQGSVAYAVEQEASARSTEDTRLAGLISTNSGNISQLQTDVSDLQNQLVWDEFTV